MRGNTCVNLRSCWYHTRYRRCGDSWAMRSGRKRRVKAIAAICRTLSRSCCILNMPWHSATALAPLKHVSSLRTNALCYIHLSSSKPMPLSASRHHLGMSSPYFARTCPRSLGDDAGERHVIHEQHPVVRTFFPPPTVKRKPRGLAAGMGSANAEVTSWCTCGTCVG